MGGHRRRGHDAGTEVTLPIAPMLDMAFQLLTFFIFTYHPSAMEGQMELALPSKMEAQAKDQKDVNPNVEANKEETPEIPLDLNVMIQKQTGDNYTLVLEEGVVRTSMQNVEALKKHLDRLFKDKEASIQDKAKSVEASKRDAFIKEEKKKLGAKVLGDSKLRWGVVVEVMDTCRTAGFGNVSFAPPPDLGLGQ
jgi:biopolymer transport protein ExbD